VVYLTPFFSSSVEWHGERIRVGKNSLIHNPARYEKLAYEKSDLARLVAVHMGLGHLRAAFPLRSLSQKGIIVWGSGSYAAPGEKKYWRAFRKVYYFLSRVGSYPVLGRLALKIIMYVQRIPPFYPKKDLSSPSLAVRFLKFLIRKAGLCRSLPEQLQDGLPVIHTFYATAMALDMMSARGPDHGDNYLLICDADINRVWVPENRPKAV